MAVKSEAEIALIRESSKWGNLAHRLLQRYTRVGADGDGGHAARERRGDDRDAPTLGPLYRGQNMFVERRARRLPRPDRPRRGDPARAREQRRLPGGRRARDRRRRAPSGATSRSSSGRWSIGAPTDEQRRMFDHMVALQDIAFEAIRPGARCSDVDRAVRAYFDEHELMPYWRHHTGHAIGLRYHEGPFLDTGDDTEIGPGMVFTVEPGLYSPELGGFRHSDTVVVTEDGIELVTYYPRDLESLVIPA